MIFSIFTELQHHYNLILENSHNPREKPPARLQSFSIPIPTLGNHLPTFCLCRFAFSGHFRELEAYTVFCVWLLSLLRLIYVVQVVHSFFIAE